MSIIQAVVAGLIGYLLGAIPVGILVCRLKGVDPRQYGSGRTGGTNVYRATGSKALGAATAAGDVVKGLLAVFVARALFPEVPLAQALAGVGAVAGHNWSAYIRFKGGAGAMTNYGALFALSPFTCVVGILVGLGAFSLSQIASVGTLMVSWAAGIMLIILAITGVDVNPFVDRQIAVDQMVYGIGQAVLITYALRPNIMRLVRGEERRVEY
jgi:glycerol-3-phosphate acyltransferase PlsY